ncbi:HNH endonuclease [Micromonospora sp. NPDC049359]|uniref:HNH endonuclease n=1 Tax=Micromonospora sp. NPDC049359 TaxID=3364270 RepID=UPI003796DB3E
MIPARQVEVRWALWMVWDQKCGWCGEQLTFSEMEVDHIIPQSLVGKDLRKALCLHGLSHDYDVQAPPNLLPSCRRCNSIKSARIAPNTPIISILLQSAERRAKRVSTRAANFKADRKVDEAFNLLTDIFSNQGLDLARLKQAGKEWTRARSAAKVIAPVVAALPEVQEAGGLALHPNLQIKVDQGRPWRLDACEAADSFRCTSFRAATESA